MSYDNLRTCEMCRDAYTTTRFCAQCQRQLDINRQSRSYTELDSCARCGKEEYKWNLFAVGNDDICYCGKCFREYFSEK